MTSLSPHLLGCLIRDLNYGPWPVTNVSMYENVSEISHVCNIRTIAVTLICMGI